MDEISALFHGFSVALTPFNILLMLVGISLGVIIGVLPGLGGANGIAKFTIDRDDPALWLIECPGIIQ